MLKYLWGTPGGAIRKSCEGGASHALRSVLHALRMCGLRILCTSKCAHFTLGHRHCFHLIHFVVGFKGFFEASWRRCHSSSGFSLSQFVLFLHVIPDRLDDDQIRFLRVLIMSVLLVF